MTTAPAGDVRPPVPTVRALVRQLACTEKSFNGESCQDQWVLTEDFDSILNAASDDLVFLEDEDVATRQALALRLQLAKYPNVDPDLTIILFDRWGALHRGFKLYVADSPFIEPFNNPSSCERVAEAAKRLGSVRLPRYHFPPHWAHDELEKLGCYCTNGRRKQGCTDPDLVWEVVYNPRVATNRIVARKKREEKQRKNKGKVIRAYEVYQAFHAIRHLLKSWLCLNFTTGHFAFEQCNDLKAVCWLFDAVYGRDAHRKVDGFQKLVRRWRNSEEQSEKYLSSLSVRREFICWMECEARRRLPKVQSLFVSLDDQRRQKALAKKEKEAEDAKTVPEANTVAVADAA